MKKSNIIIAVVICSVIAAIAGIVVNNLTKENSALMDQLKFNLQKESLSTYEESEFGVSAHLPATGDSTAIYMYDYGTDEQIFQTRNPDALKAAITDIHNSGIAYKLEKQEGDSTVVYQVKYENNAPFVPITYSHLRPEDRNN